jgi:hypothetical protein
MLAIGILASHISLGFEVSHFLLNSHFDIWLIGFLAIPIGFCIGTRFLYVFSLIFGFHFFHCLIHFIGICGLNFIFYQKYLKNKLFKVQTPSIIRIAVFVVSVISLSYILPKFYFPKPGLLPHVCF